MTDLRDYLLSQSYEFIAEQERFHLHLRPLLDMNFWKAKTEQLGIATDNFEMSGVPPQVRYVELLTKKTKYVVVGSECFLGITKCIERAARSNRPDLINYFVSRWQSRDSSDSPICHVLRGAAKSGQLRLVEECATDERFVCCCDAALYFAAKHCRYEVVSFLLARGAHVNEILRAAIKTSNVDTFRLLLHTGYNHFDYMFVAAAKGHSGAIITELLQHYTPDSQMAFRVAAGCDWVELMVYFRSVDSDLNAALCEAASQGAVTCLDQLLKWGASDVDSALAAAANSGYRSVVKRLASLGASNFAPAIYAAQEREDSEMVDILLQLQNELHLASSLKQMSI